MFTKFFKTFQVDEVPVLVYFEDCGGGTAVLRRMCQHTEAGVLDLYTTGVDAVVKALFDDFDQAEAEEFVHEQVRPQTANFVEGMRLLDSLPDEGGDDAAS